jgi:hypothetical protein
LYKTKTLIVFQLIKMADDDRKKRMEEKRRELDERRAKMRHEADERLIRQERERLSRELDQAAHTFQRELAHENLYHLPDYAKLKILESLHGEEKARAIAHRLGLPMRAGTPPRRRESSSDDEGYAGGHEAKRSKK